MSEKLTIPETNAEQNKQNEVAFMQAYGKSYRKMKKDELAQMIMNQSINVMKYKDENYKIAKIALVFRRQRDSFKKMLRKRDGFDRDEPSEPWKTHKGEYTIQSECPYCNNEFVCCSDCGKEICDCS